MGDTVLITGSNESIHLVKDPTKILETQEKVVRLHDQTAGLTEVLRYIVGQLVWFNTCVKQKKRMHLCMLFINTPLIIRKLWVRY